LDFERDDRVGAGASRFDLIANWQALALIDSVKTPKAGRSASLAAPTEAHRDSKG